MRNATLILSKYSGVELSGTEEERWRETEDERSKRSWKGGHAGGKPWSKQVQRLEFVEEGSRGEGRLQKLEFVEHGGHGGGKSRRRETSEAGVREGGRSWTREVVEKGDWAEAIS